MAVDRVLLVVVEVRWNDRQMVQSDTTVWTRRLAVVGDRSSRSSRWIGGCHTLSDGCCPHKITHAHNACTVGGEI